MAAKGGHIDFMFLAPSPPAAGSATVSSLFYFKLFNLDCNENLFFRVHFLDATK